MELSSQYERESPVLIAETLAILDEWWDDAVGFLRQADDAHPLPPPDAPHMIRDSVTYALGLLMRQGPSDLDRANRIIRQALDYQFDEPQQPYHGSFYRFTEEPHPPRDALIWRDYDPNWREFIGATLVIVLAKFRDSLEPGLEGRIDRAFRLLISGTLERRLPATYSNIALLKAFMLVFSGEHFGNPAWTALGESLAEEIYSLFSENSCFEEYNSPTYYGVDLHALGMWISFSTSPRLCELGGRMEALLWQEVARLYHAGLKNICGPFDRSYGMDMRKYVTGVGMSLRLEFGKEFAPLPDTGLEANNFEGNHKNDLTGAFLMAAVGVRIPPEARPDFLLFRGERAIERIITTTPRRIATAWLAQNMMLGAEDASGTRPVWNQYHPVTIHWRLKCNEVGWLKLIHNLPLDARVDKNRLSVKSFVWHGLGAQERFFIFRIFAPASYPGQVKVEPDHWRLPGLVVRMETNTESPRVTHDGAFIEIYYGANQMDVGSHIFFNLTAEWQESA